MIRLFCGHDPREEPGLHTFIHSLLRRATAPLSITPLTSLGLAEGSNAFTLSRFLVAQLCEYRGRAIFLDGSDMLALADIAELDALFDPAFAVQVVKHPPYLSRHERKYMATEMECPQSNYPRKNWASVMLVNCEHPGWREAHLQMLAGTSALGMLSFSFLRDEEIGELPPCWNVLVDEGQDDSQARILHWTAGIPGFAHYQNARRSVDWFRAFSSVCGAVPASARFILAREPA